MKQKTRQCAISLKVVVCTTLSHNVPDHSSMLPCSGKGHSDSLSFLCFSLTCYLPKKKKHWQWCNTRLTITTTWMENGFEIKERVVKERRIYRKKRERKRKRHDEGTETEIREQQHPSCSNNTGKSNQHATETLINSWDIRASELRLFLLLSVLHCRQTDRQEQSSGKYQVTMTSICTKCTGTKVSRCCPTPSHASSCPFVQYYGFCTVCSSFIKWLFSLACHART